MVYIGIDPGKKGGYAIISKEELSPSSVTVRPMDEKSFVEDMHFISEAFSTNEIRCCLEKVGAMPKQGIASTWKFAEGYGLIQGVLKAFGIPYQTVPPQTWKKEFSLLHQDKSKSIETAMRLFPDTNFMPTERSRKPSDGMCESALMCEYARRKL